MKQVVAIIRMDKINDTKKALSQAGYPSMLCKKVSGRGKKMIKLDFLEELIAAQADSNTDLADLSNSNFLESLTENNRFIAKRYVELVVHDEDVKKVVDILIDTNQTGSMGDGKIFILPIEDAVRVRTGEVGDQAL